jgi:ABC-2 type transport system permease protein
MCWTLMNVGFYLLLFKHVSAIGANSGWGRNEFFVFLGTTWIINSLMQAFVMPNAEEFSELIRSGGLDFALLKPIDTQFLISFRKIHWSSLSNLLVGLALIVVAMMGLPFRQTVPWVLHVSTIPLYVLFLICGFVILYSLMVCLAATSIWLGRNQSLYDFWFYITNFSRYPMEIYQTSWGIVLWTAFTFLIPVLVVVNIPAQVLAQPIHPKSMFDWLLPVFTVFAAIVCFAMSRWVFRRALLSYRSASS